MCRNIKRLYNFEPPASDDEIRASALQYVRKVSGMAEPSAANRTAFDEAVAQITAITARLLHEELTSRAAPRDWVVEAERARERGWKREAVLRARSGGP